MAILNRPIAPLQHPAADRFATFDEDATNLMSSLHLDAEEEPRRGMGAASRANSVRFDESANQNHISHLTRPSFDYLSRTSSGSGALALGERSASHKSDGRASSAHSMRSLASGRANSLNLDTTYAAGGSSRSSQDAPMIAPGMLLLGPVPAIIRCWMNTNFKHNALLYAAVCTGSYRSFLALSLIKTLGFEEQIITNDDGSRQIELPVYLPEAVPHPASSRSSSPAPQLPSLTVTFHVIDTPGEDSNKAIQIFLGSDTLRFHSADILLSSNSMTLLDDDRCKLSIPLVRPEDESTFNTLQITGGAVDSRSQQQPYSNGLEEHDLPTGDAVSAAAASVLKYRPPQSLLAEGTGTSDSARQGAVALDAGERPISRASNASRPSLNIIARTESVDGDANAGNSTQRSASGSPAVWSNWRRDGSSVSSITPTAATLTPTGLDWGAVASKGRDATSFQRKDGGIKVLKPKSASRTVSSSNNVMAPNAAQSSTTAASPMLSDSRSSSRFFDDGRQKSNTSESKDADKKDGIQTPASATGQKSRTNPVGTGSAFSWLNSNGM